MSVLSLLNQLFLYTLYLYEKYLKLLPRIESLLLSRNKDTFLTTTLELFKQDQINLTHLFSEASSTESVLSIIGNVWQ